MTQLLCLRPTLTPKRVPRRWWRPGLQPVLGLVLVLAGALACITTAQSSQQHTLETLAEARAQAVELLEAVDTGAAQSWFAASRLESWRQRAADERVDEQERALWQLATQREESAADRLRGALDRVGMAEETPERLAEVSGRVENGPPQVDPEAFTRISELESARAALEQQRLRTTLEAEQRRTTLARLSEQHRLHGETLERLQLERSQELDAFTFSAGPQLADAEEALYEATRRRADARLLAAELDALTLPPRLITLQAEILALEWQAGALRRPLESLDVRLSELTSEELIALRGDLQRLTDREPDLQARYPERLAQLTHRFDQIATQQDRIRQLQRDRERYHQLHEEVSQTLANVRERLEISGLTEALGGLFIEEQRRLREFDDKPFIARQLERELTQSRLRHISLREQLAQLSSETAIDPEDIAAHTLLVLERETLSTQLRIEQALVEQLMQTDRPLRQLIERVEALDTTLRETLLWWPSHPPVGWVWLQGWITAGGQVAEPESWQEIRAALRYILLEAPVGLAVTILLAAGLAVAGRGTRTHLEALACRTRHRFTDRIGLTFQALGWSLLRVAPIPLLLLVTGLRLDEVPGVGHGVETLATVLVSASIWWLAGHLLLLLTARHGVGTIHLNWNSLLIRRLRRHLSWFLPTQLLLIIALALFFGHPSGLVADVFGRIGLLITICLTVVLAWLLLAPPPEPDAPLPLTERRRRLLRAGIAFYGFLLAGLALAGYLLTVGELLGRTIDTLAIIGAAWLLYGLALRALLLSEHRLRIRQLREQKTASADSPGSGTAIGAEGTVEVTEPRLSVEDVNQQTRTLIRVTVGGGAILALLWAWADMLPALTWLDQITLWSRVVSVGETEMISRVSVQDLLLALILAWLFTLAGRNLPGLVEIILARSTGLDNAARYTVTMLLRYVVAVAAIITVFSLLGLRWNELQWLVAALTLGLGFGLQEVVANFVSGLIVLFERPVRVGDTISIGEHSGTVSRIRTRATTIVDWDNREIVIPNKSFITERLTNWTLTDTTTRIIIPVGVSYNVDPDHVRETLLDIARDNPHVIDEPAPTVFFLRFGDSALNFELRAYVNVLSDRLVTISELHTAIIKRFRSEGIGIAYPQVDLHIRDGVPPYNPPSPTPGD